MTPPAAPLRFKKECLELLDQRKLPETEVWLACKNENEVICAIQEMVVRGAPAIGVSGGYALYLAMRGFAGSRSDFLNVLEDKVQKIAAARPTAVNLSWAVRRIQKKILAGPGLSVDELKKLILKEAQAIHREDEELGRAIGKHGAGLFAAGDSVLTHCNAGGLATSGFGTALAPFYFLKAKGTPFHVYATETRPLLQGARLTAWELSKAAIPFTLICESAAASLMRQGKIKKVIVGADRIAVNGDTANKIGTYSLALAAKAHGIPFYVAAPSSTFDAETPAGDQISIELRRPEEITEGMGKRTAPRGTAALNPAFDVTPHELITAFITEKGVTEPACLANFLLSAA